MRAVEACDSGLLAFSVSEPATPQVRRAAQGVPPTRQVLLPTSANKEVRIDDPETQRDKDDAGDAQRCRGETDTRHIE